MPRTPWTELADYAAEETDPGEDGVRRSFLTPLSTDALAIALRLRRIEADVARGGEQLVLLERGHDARDLSRRTRGPNQVLLAASVGAMISRHSPAAAEGFEYAGRRS